MPIVTLKTGDRGVHIDYDVSDTDLFDTDEHEQRKLITIIQGVIVGHTFRCLYNTPEANTLVRQYLGPFSDSTVQTGEEAVAVLLKRHEQYSPHLLSSPPAPYHLVRYDIRGTMCLVKQKAPGLFGGLRFNPKNLLSAPSSLILHLHQQWNIDMIWVEALHITKMVANEYQSNPNRFSPVNAPTLGTWAIETASAVHLYLLEEAGNM